VDRKIDILFSGSEKISNSLHKSSGHRCPVQNTAFVNLYSQAGKHPNKKKIFNSHSFPQVGNNPESTYLLS